MKTARSDMLSRSPSVAGALGVKTARSDMLWPGDRVEVFFRSRIDELGCFPVTDALSAQLRPRFGWTDCWVPARVLEERAAGDVLVCHTHPLWSNRGGDLLCDRELAATAAAAAAACNSDKSGSAEEATKLASAAGCTGCFSRADVRVFGDGIAAPVMSVVVVRWGGETTDFNEAQWGALSSSVSDRYIHSFLDQMYACLGPAYEVLSIFVETGADLARVPLGGTLSSLLRGSHRCALYFLWPTLAQDGGEQQMGMLPAGDVFGAMRQVEAAGIPTRFPHPSQLYAILLSKEWQASLCLSREYWVPPTTLVNRAAVASDPRHAASGAMAALERIRASASARGCNGDAPARSSVHPLAGTPGIRLGVAKLGHAWETKQVRVFVGEAQLAAALKELCKARGCEATSVIVQDFIPNDFEMRVYVIRGVIRHTIFSSFGGFNEDGLAYNFVQKSRVAAVSDWLCADERAMERAERRAAKLVERWLAWLSCLASAHGAPPAIRMDFLVRRTAPGRAKVYTLELTELGFSLLGWYQGPRLVLSALLESCFDDTGATAAESELLHAHRQTAPLAGDVDEKPHADPTHRRFNQRKRRYDE